MASSPSGDVPDVAEGSGGLADRLALVIAMVATVVAFVILLTELTSNTATAATFLPVLGALALVIGQDPLVLAVPAALAASGVYFSRFSAGDVRTDRKMVLLK